LNAGRPKDLLERCTETPNDPDAKSKSKQSAHDEDCDDFDKAFADLVDESTTYESFDSNHHRSHVMDGTSVELLFVLHQKWSILYQEI
jgi:hypothetical protein